LHLALRHLLGHLALGLWLHIHRRDPGDTRLECGHLFWQKLFIHAGIDTGNATLFEHTLCFFYLTLYNSGRRISVTLGL
jgi:hypothetical protein